MPYEIQEVMDRYKKQIITLGIDVERLERMKVRAEITLSNLVAEERDKKEMVEKVENKIKELAPELNSLGEKRIIALKEIKEAEEQSIEIEKESKERLANAVEIEKQARIALSQLTEERRNLETAIEKNGQETKEIERKKKVLSEILNKL